MFAALDATLLGVALEGRNEVQTDRRRLGIARSGNRRTVVASRVSRQVGIRIMPCLDKLGSEARHAGVVQADIFACKEVLNVLIDVLAFVVRVVVVRRRGKPSQRYAGIFRYRGYELPVGDAGKSDGLSLRENPDGRGLGRWVRQAGLGSVPAGPPFVLNLSAQARAFRDGCALVGGAENCGDAAFYSPRALYLVKYSVTAIRNHKCHCIGNIVDDRANARCSVDSLQQPVLSSGRTFIL